MPLIALSALQQRNRLTGTGRYISELMRALPSTRPGTQFILYAKPDQGEALASCSDQIRFVASCPSHPVARSLWEYVNFPGVLKRDDVDLYHGPANFLPPRKPCPFVLTLHDMVYFHNPGRTFPLRAWYWQWSIRSTWQLADLILTVSHFSRRQIQKYISVPDRLIRVIPNGVDRRFFEPASDSRRAAMREICHLPNPYILYVGRLDPDKNVRRLIRAYALLVKAGRCDADLAIAGIPEFQVSDLPALIDRLGIADRVQFLGFVPEENLVALYQEAAAFCFPSLNEGFGLPVLEAMAAGVPVVTSNISSLPEVAGDACVLVDPFSPREIARGLAQALRPRMARELSEAGRERASEFTWERAAAATADAYDEVLSPTAQSRGRRR